MKVEIEEQINQIDGALFGHEEENEIKVENAFPIWLESKNLSDELKNIVI